MASTTLKPALVAGAPSPEKVPRQTASSCLPRLSLSFGRYKRAKTIGCRNPATYDLENHEPGKTHPWWPLDLPILIKQLSVAVCAIASRCALCATALDEY